MAAEVIILLQARMGSTRLPGKALAQIGGVSVLAHCLNRLRAAAVGPVILATTWSPQDDALVWEAARVGVTSVRGSESDVLQRFAQAVRQMPASFVVRATADNPAVDIEAPRRALAALAETGADYCCEQGLPVGGAVEAMRVRVLLEAEQDATASYDREHVTPFIRRERARFAVIEPSAPEPVRRPSLSLTIDRPEDLTFMRAVAGRLGTSLSRASLASIVCAAEQAAAEERVA